MEKICDLPSTIYIQVRSDGNDLCKEQIRYKILGLNYLVDPLLETYENKCNADHPQMSKAVTECQRWHKE